MHLTPSDPDIATLYRKILQNRLDLQPDFQRGEVWGRGKKQRLIDSILRGWHIPPIHVIQVKDSDKQEVLDGQQRLAAIRDFINNEFPINGNQPPFEDDIIALDGFYWENLPSVIKASIEDFTIRILTISNYKPGEPGELFYRLNQPTNLTSAEQRNAYYGEARQQVKDLAEYMAELGISREQIGFSNSRMAYDDVIAKFLLTLEMNALTKKVTANAVTVRYRESNGFNPNLVDSAATCIKLLRECLSRRAHSTRLNKATISCWLVFIYSANQMLQNPEAIFEFFDIFETLRERGEHIDHMLPEGIHTNFVLSLLLIYQDRSSSRVADTTSVVLRDMILWGIFTLYNPQITMESHRLSELSEHFYSLSQRHDRSVTDPYLWNIVKFMNWGASL